MNGQFDKSALSILLKKALGNRTQKSFAEDIQISKEHLSRLVNQKRDTPPNIDTLNKIALNSACGYDPNTLAVPAATSHMMEAIMLALSHSPYAFSKHSCDSTDFYQMILQFSGGSIDRWYFHFLPDNTFAAANHELAGNLLYLISKEMKPNYKVSFVTSIPLLFQYYIEHRPYNLDLNFSLILINEPTLSVSKEAILQTACSLRADVLDKYLFPSSPE